MHAIEQLRTDSIEPRGSVKINNNDYTGDFHGCSNIAATPAFIHSLATPAPSSSTIFMVKLKTKKNIVRQVKQPSAPSTRICNWSYQYVCPRRFVA